MSRRLVFADDEESSGSKLFGSFVAGIAMTPMAMVFAVIPAWVVMLALGAAHDQWPVIPALGYWTTYILMLGVGLVNPFRRAS